MIDDENKSIIDLQAEFTANLIIQIDPIRHKLQAEFGIDNVRLTILSIPVQILNFQLLVLKSAEQTVFDDDWLNKMGINDNNDKKNYKKLYVRSIFFMNFINLVSQVESELRKVIKELYPNTCRDGKAEFESIYKKLFSEVSLTKYNEIFDFIRMVRNTIHNNGCYYPTKSVDDKKMVYIGKEFVFQYGKPINFVDYKLLLFLQKDIFDCLMDICKTYKWV